jgi:hypothetical protein
VKNLFAELHHALRTDVRILNRLAYYLVFGHLPRITQRQRVA